MKGFLFNFLTSLFKQANRVKNVNDVPELTNFLKNNEIFKAAAWKIHDIKNKAVQKMDDVAFQDDPKNKPKSQNHHHTHNKSHHNKHK